MASAAEGAGAKQGIAANLAVGLDTISNDDEVVFTQYIRVVLPLDGFVFWVRTDLVSESALLNALQLNTSEMNATLNLVSATPIFTAKGSFHYSTQQKQDEAESEATNTVVFTSEEPVQQFNEVNSSILWIGRYGGDIENYDGPIQFAFSSRGRYYQAADLFHYSGTAVLPAFEAQLIDDPDQLLSRDPFVSNSLPVWLLLSNYSPPYDNGISNSLVLYPSFLMPNNLVPPYGAVHVETTESLQAAPIFDAKLGQQSLCYDHVRVTLYGLDNSQAMMFLAAVLQYSYDYNTIGMGNMPSVRDEKRTSPELNVIAQKKTIEFEVSYYQGVMRDIARQVISSILVLQPSARSVENVASGPAIFVDALPGGATTGSMVSDVTAPNAIPVNAEIVRIETVSIPD